MKGTKLYLILGVVAIVLFYLFSKKTSGAVAPTSGTLPITGYQGAPVLGANLSALPPTGLVNSGSASNNGSVDTGGVFVPQGPSLPPGYDPNDPSTWPSGLPITSADPGQNLSQLPAGSAIADSDPVSLYSTLDI